MKIHRSKQNCQLCYKRYLSTRTEGVIVCMDCRKKKNWLIRLRALETK
jgi:hypothetical protein